MVPVQPEAIHTSPEASFSPYTKGKLNILPGGRSLKFILLVLAVAGLFFSGQVHGQTNGDYRTIGNVNFVLSTNWQIYNGGWIPAPLAPDWSNGVITIRSGHTATVTAAVTLNQLVVENGAVFNINGGITLTLTDGPSWELDVIGTVNNSGTITNGGTIRFRAPSVYNHTRNGGAVPDALWNLTSSCNITGVTTTSPSGLNQTFGNFTWNCLGQTTNVYMQSDITIAGDFYVAATTPGDYDPIGSALRMSNTAIGNTIDVGGDMIIDNNASFKMNNGTGSCFMNIAGNFLLNSGAYCIVTGNASSTLTVSGDVTISGGIMIMQEDGNATPVATWNIGGDFTLSSGTVTAYNGSDGDIHFNGGTTQTYLRTAGTIENEINFHVDDGSVLDVGTSTINGSTGNFTLNSNAGIITAHADGLSNTPGIGSIQVSGTRTFSTGADYTYNGTVGQVTGNALPSTVRDLTIDNASGVSLTNGPSVTGTLYLSSGNLILSTNHLTIDPSGLINGGTSSSYVVADNTGTLIQEVTGTSKAFPVGTAGSYLPITLGNSGTGDNLGIRVFADVLEGGTGGAQIAEIDDCVNATWVVSEETAGGSNLSLTVQWNGTDEGTGFDRSDCGIGYHDGAGWLAETVTGAAGGGDPYSRSRSGVEGVGSFAVGKYCSRMYDDDPPTITCPGNLASECDISEHPVYADFAAFTAAGGSASDLCGLNVSSFAHVSDVSDGLSCPETITRTYEISDNAGNTATCEQLIVINPTTPPSEVGGPVSTSSTVECASDAVAPALPVVEDVCGNVLTPAAPVLSGTYVDCEGTIIYTYTYTDCPGLTFDWVYTYTVDITTPPAEVGGPVSTSSTVECASDAVAPGLPVVEDVCGNVLTPAAPVLSGTYVDCEGTIIYTYTYTDCSGLTYDWVYTYTVDITTPPAEVGGPVPTNGGTVECLADAVAPTVLPVVHDVCGNVLAPASIMNGGTYDGCEGTYTWIYTYTDCSGLTYDWIYQYYINDDVPPNLIPKQNIAVELSAINGLYILTSADIDSISYDRCGNPISMYLDRDTLTCEDVGVIPVTFYARDNCGNLDSLVVNVTVDYEIEPDPQVNYDSIICDGEVLEIELNNPFDNMKFVWAVSNNPFITGSFTSPDSINGGPYPFTIQDTLYNTSNTVQSVVYTIKAYPWSGPVYDALSCGIALDTTFTVYVNPRPEMSATVIDTIICNDEDIAFTVDSLVSTLGTVRYGLDVSTSSANVTSTLPASSVRDISNFTDHLINTGNAVEYVTYTFTPFIQDGAASGNCNNGVVETITIYVNPTPEMSVAVSDLIICNDEDVAFTIDSLVSTLGTVRYTLDVALSSGNVSSTYPPTSTRWIANFTDHLINTGNEVESVTYTFTPFIENGTNLGDCNNGIVETVTVFVNPTPAIQVTASDTLLCNEENVSFNIQNLNPNVNGDWKYNLTVDYGTHVSGMNIGGEYTNLDLSLMDQLLNSDTAVHVVSYHFTPRITPGDGGADCGSGLDTIIYIWVNPTPEIRVNVADTVICNEDFIDFNVRNPNVPARGDWKYNLTVVYENGLITGNDIGGEYDDTDVLLTDQLVNWDTVWHWVEYTFTPRISPDDLGPDCLEGIETVIRVLVHPTPAIRVLAQDSIICNGEQAVIEVQNPNIFVPDEGDWEYDLTVVPDPEITNTLSNQTNITDTLLIDNLINNDTIVHKVEYRFTPAKTPDPELCAGGNDTTIVIWVNPTPEVRLMVSDTVLCDGDDLTIDLRNPNVPILGTWEGTLEILVDNGITGVVAGTYLFTADDTYFYNLRNSDIEARSVTYIFSPRIRDNDGDWCNNGIIDTVVVWVNPVPDIRVSATDTLICNEEFAQFKVEGLNSNVRGEWRYLLDVEADPEILGARADGDYPIDSLLIQDQLTNTDTVAHKVTYHFTPFIAPSDGEADCGTDRDTLFTIWVNPTPRIYVDFPDTIFCNNDTAVISVLHGVGLPVYGEREYFITADYNPDSVTVISREAGVQNTLRPGSPITDIYVNHTQEAHPVVYTFTPIISDTRIGYEGSYCRGEDILVRVWINPTPQIIVAVTDSILCDSTNVDISISSQLGNVMGGTLIYDLVVSYDPGGVSGTITGDGEWEPDQTINDFLVNTSDTVQVVRYQFTARIRDDRLGQAGSFCNNGSDSIIDIYLNPYPRLRNYLEEDSLCFNDGFTIETDPLVYATHPLYYDLEVTNANNLVNVASDGSYPAAGDLDQRDVLNNNSGYGRIIYHISPYISTEGCPGTDTTFIVDVNPEPLMTAGLLNPRDTAVCFDWGYEIVVNENFDLDSTTGTPVYQMDTYGYNFANVTNVSPDNDYAFVNLDESNVRNIGDSIEEISYHFIPVIRDVNGQGKHCFGSSTDSIIPVEVAPELRGSLEPDTSYVGGNIVRCYGLEETTLHSNVRGGYYERPYDFTWNTNGGSPVISGDSIQTSMGIGLYWFTVQDVIGCAFSSDTLEVTQPDELGATAVIVDASCWTDTTADGSIDITPFGGIPAYEYFWRGPYGFTSTDEDIYNIPASPNYRLRITDVNECVTSIIYEVESAAIISIDTTVSQFGNYQISCAGDSTGWIYVQSSGGFPGGYTLEVIDVNSGLPVYDQPMPPSNSTTVTGLSAGEYEVIVRDQAECPNYNPLGTTNLLREPQPISISRDTEQFYHDTVDVSCYGADDGFINLVVSGGHTEYLASNFIWTGPDPDLVQGDSIQVSLSGGTYRVELVDNFGCTDSAEFTLFEPAPIVLDVDTIGNYNGWNISCYGRNDGFIEISTSGGIMGHTYLWTPGSMTLPDRTQQDIYDLFAGTFDLTVTDSIGCTLETTFELLQPNPLDIVGEVSEFNGYQVDCWENPSGWINLTPLGGADSTQNSYAWETDFGTLGDTTLRDQSNLTAGIYWVKVTDINGCEITEYFGLTQPNPLVIDTFMVDSAFCFGSATGAIDMILVDGGGVEPYDFSWSPNGQTTEDIDSLLAGVYTITITDANGCILIDSAEVFEADHFGVGVLVVSDYNGAVISCTGYADGAIAVDTANIGGTEPYNYFWNTGATTLNLEGLPAGTYEVTVVDKHGCVDSSEVTLVDPMPINYVIQEQDPLCFGDSTGQIDLLLTGGTVYSTGDYQVWLNGIETGAYARDLPSGVYQIRVEDLNDCFAEDETELIDPPLLTLSFDTQEAFCPDKPDGQLNLYIDGGEPGYWISWSGELSANETYFSDLRSGVYVATVRDAHECVTSDTVLVGYAFESCLVIPNAISPNGDGFNDYWLIEGLELYPNAEIRIFDRWGTMIYYSPNPMDDPWDGTFEGRTLPIDSYHYIIDLHNDEKGIPGNVTIVR